jgi:hypothetical protein
MKTFIKPSPNLSSFVVQNSEREVQRKLDAALEEHGAR